MSKPRIRDIWTGKKIDGANELHEYMHMSDITKKNWMYIVYTVCES